MTNDKISSRRKNFLCLALLFLTAFLVYRPLLNNFFVADDAGWLWAGKHYGKVYFTFHPSKEFQVFRPVPVFVFFVLYNLFHTHPFPYFFFMIFLHGMNACLIFLLLKQLFTHENTTSNDSFLQRFLPAFMFAGFFLIEQGVAWISCMEYVCMFFFYVLCIVLYSKFRDTQNTAYYILSLLSFLFSLFSLETAVTLPLLLFFIERKFSSPQKPFLKCLKTLLPFFVLAVLYAAFIKIFFYIKLPYTKPPLLDMSTLSHFLNDGALFFISLWSNLINVFTHNIAVRTDQSFNQQWMTTAAYAVIFMALTLLFMAHAKKESKTAIAEQNIFLFFFLWTFLNLILPSLFGTTSIADVFSIPRSRQLYLPSAGMCVMASMILFSLLHSLLKNNVFKTALLVLFMLCFLLKNGLLIKQLDALYEKASAQNMQLVGAVVHATKNAAEKSKLFLVDFPDGYKIYYGIFLPQFLEVFQGESIDMVWLKESQFPLKAKFTENMNNDYFLKFYSGTVFNATLYYRKMLRQGKQKSQ